MSHNILTPKQGHDRTKDKMEISSWSGMYRVASHVTEAEQPKNKEISFRVLCESVFLLGSNCRVLTMGRETCNQG